MKDLLHLIFTGKQRCLELLPVMGGSIFICPFKADKQK